MAILLYAVAFMVFVAGFVIAGIAPVEGMGAREAFFARMLFVMPSVFVGLILAGIGAVLSAVGRVERLARELAEREPVVVAAPALAPPVAEPAFDGHREPGLPPMPAPLNTNAARAAPVAVAAGLGALAVGAGGLVATRAAAAEPEPAPTPAVAAEPVAPPPVAVAEPAPAPPTTPEPEPAAAPRLVDPTETLRQQLGLAPMDPPPAEPVAALPPAIVAELAPARLDDDNASSRVAKALEAAMSKARGGPAEVAPEDLEPGAAPAVDAGPIDPRASVALKLEDLLDDLPLDEPTEAAPESVAAEDVAAEVDPPPEHEPEPEAEPEPESEPVVAETPPEPEAEPEPEVAAEPEPAPTPAVPPLGDRRPPTVGEYISAAEAGQEEDGPVLRVVREGQFAGRRYRMFEDGSLAIDTDQSTIRFASLDEFRAFVSNASKRA